MAKYSVHFTFVDSGVILIEAESEHEAIGLAQREITQWDTTHRDSFFDAHLEEDGESD